MNRFLALFVVVLLLFCLSNRATASFENGQMSRVIYQDNGTVEFATDLGTVNATTLLTTNMPFAGQTSFQ